MRLKHAGRQPCRGMIVEICRKISDPNTIVHITFAAPKGLLRCRISIIDKEPGGFQLIIWTWRHDSHCKWIRSRRPMPYGLDQLRAFDVQVSPVAEMHSCHKASAVDIFQCRLEGRGLVVC